MDKTETRLTQFRCGHPDRGSATLSSYEDGQTLHTAGHILYRDGEYAAALTCMQRSAGRGNLWADRDTVVVKEAREIEEATVRDLAELPESPPEDPAGRGGTRTGPPAGRGRAWTVVAIRGVIDGLGQNIGPQHHASSAASRRVIDGTVFVLGKVADL